MNGEMNKKERRLYWQDVWQRIKKSWVLVLAITLVCGIAIDLLGYMRNRDGNAVHIDQTADQIREQLSEEEQATVESVLQNKKQMQSMSTYLERSVLMNVDVMHIATEKLTFQLSVPGSAAIQSCYEVLTGQDFLQRLAQKLSWQEDASYLKELISVSEIDSGNSLTLSSLFDNDYIHLTIYGETPEQAAAIADYVEQELHAVTLAKGSTCTQVSRTQTFTTDTKILERKTTLNDSLTSLTSSSTSAQAKLSRLQKDLLAKEMEEEGFAQEDITQVAAVENPASVLQPKYLVVGLLFGLLLGVLVVVLRYLASTCVRSVRDLQDLEPFDYVAELTAENAQAGPLLAAYLKTVCAKRGLTQVVLLASQALQPAAQSAVQSAEQLLRQSGLETVSCPMDTADPAALPQILTAQSVVPVVELDRTDCCTLHQEMELCRRENIPVLAGIVL